MLLRNREKITSDLDAGLILGYKLTEPAFEPVLKLASKEGVGWNYPTFISDIIRNPAPLLLNEKWIYDPIAFHEACNFLRKDIAGVDKIEYLFSHSKRFEGIEVQKLLSSGDDIDNIRSTMTTCETQAFRDAIHPLTVAYGKYAVPSNLDFERLNAGIISAISSRYKQLKILDDTIRAPVYSYLALGAFNELNADQERLNEVVQAFRVSLISVPNMIDSWNPEEFIKIHNSKGAEQLREEVYKLRDPRLTVEDIKRYVDRTAALSFSLVKGKNVVYALSGLGLTGITLAQSLANPFFLIPTLVFLGISSHQTISCIEDLLKSREFRWLKVAENVARMTLKTKDGETQQR